MNVNFNIKEKVDSIYPEIVKIRRQLHENPELSQQEKETSALVCKVLDEHGISYQSGIAGYGVVAQIGHGSRAVGIRADMDALPVCENTGLPYASKVEGVMHACGHDMHTAMLLGAAKLLRQYQAQLNGTVKLVFQPDEEGFTGAKSMLQAGVLNNPKPQIGLALHVNSGTPSGLILCGRGTFMAGCTLFRIAVHGVGCHGAMPETGVDPLNIAAHIYLSLQELISREISAKQPAVVTIGHMQGGQAPNIIPQSAILEGTIRTFDRDLTARIMQRMETIAKCTAQAFRGSAEVTELASAPPLVNAPDLVNQMADFAQQLVGEQAVYRLDEGGMGSEDFASYTYELPCAYLLLGAGTPNENPLYGKPMHNEKVVFNEDVLPLGAALHTWCALNWLSQ